MLQPKNSVACLALSGGMDSTSLLIHLLAKAYHVTAVSFMYGQKHLIEIECAKQIIDYLQQKSLPVTHHIIELKGLENVLFSSLIQHDLAIPKGHYCEDTMRSTVVPNRNKMFISILQSIALSIATKDQQNTLVAMGVQAGDHTTYPDCRQEFIDADYQAYLSGNWDASLVSNYLPYINMDKHGILLDGLTSCSTLNLDFDEVYKRTITSYAPNNNGVSDYESGSSIARIEAFMKLQRQDPIPYANDSGLVSWETVTAHVKEVLKNKMIE